jgi:hypothetical protein
MALLEPPKVDDVTLILEKDVANANFTIEYTINWSAFDRATNLAYTEVVKLVGNDPNRQQDLFTAPIFANGVSSNGNATTDRVHPASGSFTIPWAILDEDPGVDAVDEIVAVVTLTPRLPVAVTGQSAEVEVVAP